MEKCKWYQVCPIKYFTDQGLLNKYWVKNYCFDDWEKCLRYQKEETGIFHSDRLLPDGTFIDSSESKKQENQEGC